MQSYRAAMFVLHIDSFKARAMFAPRSCAVKNPMEPPLRHQDSDQTSLLFPYLDFPIFFPFAGELVIPMRMCTVPWTQVWNLCCSNSRKRKMKSRAEVCFRVCFHVNCELAFYKYRFDKLNWGRTSSYEWKSLEWPLNTWAFDRRL